MDMSVLFVMYVCVLMIPRLLHCFRIYLFSVDMGLCRSGRENRDLHTFSEGGGVLSPRECDEWMIVCLVDYYG